MQCIEVRRSESCGSAACVFKSGSKAINLYDTSRMDFQVIEILGNSMAIIFVRDLSLIGLHFFFVRMLMTSSWRKRGTRC